jgi:hypothetical protein
MFCARPYKGFVQPGRGDERVVRWIVKKLWCSLKEVAKPSNVVDAREPGRNIRERDGKKEKTQRMFGEKRER